jgi:hypothetical protein
MLADLRASIHRLVGLLSRRVWLVLVLLSAVLAGAWLCRLAGGYLPEGHRVLALLSASWPEVRLHGERYELVGDYPSLYGIDLPGGWRLIFDPNEEMDPEDLKPRTVVIQQGKVLTRRLSGGVRSSTWKISVDHPVTIDRNVFRKGDRLLFLAVLGASMILFVGAFAVATASAAFGAGFVLLLELVGFWQAPPKPFGYAAAVLGLPVLGYTGLFLAGVRLSKVGLIAVLVYLTLLVAVWLWVRRVEAESW